MAKFRLIEDFQFVASPFPDIEYITFEKGSVIEQIPYSKLNHDQKKYIKTKSRLHNENLIVAYDPKGLKMRYWRMKKLQLIRQERFKPTRGKK